MADEAIHSIRQLATASLAVFLLAVLSWPSIERKMEISVYARDLHAWLVLNETLRGIVDELILSKGHKIVRTRSRSVEMGGQDTSYEETVPIQATILWPEPMTVHFSLHPVIAQRIEPASPTTGSLRAFSIEASSRSLPFHEYQLMLVNDRMVAVVPAHSSVYRDIAGKPHVRNSQRLIEREVRNAARPSHWPKVELHIRYHGFNGDLPSLTTRHDSLVKLQLENDPAKSYVQVFGFELNIRIFVLTIGFLYAAIAFSMISPLGIVKSARFKSSSTWIMAARVGEGRRNRVLNGIIMVLTLIWAVSPLAIVAGQLKLSPFLGLAENAALAANGLALAFASAIFIRTAVVLRKVRLAGRIG